MSDGLKLTLAQLSPETGNLRVNAETIIRIARENADSDLVVFPGSFLCGYPLEDLFQRDAFLSNLYEAKRDIECAIGAIDGPTVVTGGFNGNFIAMPNRVKNSVSELSRDVLGKSISIKGFKIGILDGSGIHDDSIVDMDLAIITASNPYARSRRMAPLEARMASLAKRCGVSVVYLNASRSHEEHVFEGTSFAIDEIGNTVLRMDAFTNDLARMTFPFKEEGKLNLQQPPETLDYLACVTGLRAYVESNELPGVVLGISGGMDSALVAAMAVDALGASRVLGVTLPSAITSSDSLGDARALCERLNIEMQTIPIGESVECVRKMLGIGGRPARVTEENIQARMRMMALMAISNETGRLVLSTGNKSEGAVGYATLYGDMAGGFNPIKDLYKTEVWALGRLRNRMAHDLLGPDHPIPESIIAKPPTAELATGQTDEASLGPYPVLDTTLRGLIDMKLSAKETLISMRSVLSKGNEPGEFDSFINLDYVRKISNLVKSAEFKRRQAAPGVRLTEHAYRYPMTHGFDF